MAHAKVNLPEKICLYCRRPFVWRKKWWRCWDEVRFCSERCKKTHKASTNVCGAGQRDDEF